MKLRNKKTGEIVEAESCNSATGMIGIFYESKDGQIGTKDCFETLAELITEWEDYEEPEEHWAIELFGETINTTDLSRLQLEKLRQFGNDFETREEAVLAVRKLKAYKRLKDKGILLHLQKQFRGDGIGYSRTIYTDFSKESEEFIKDLDLLFGGEE